MEHPTYTRCLCQGTQQDLGHTYVRTVPSSKRSRSNSTHSLPHFQKFITLLLFMTLFHLSAGKMFKVPLLRSRGTIGEEVNVNGDDYDSSGEVGVPLSSERQNLGGLPGEGYYVEMKIGTPPNVFNVLVDTGSSNFALASSPNPDITIYYNTSDSTSYEDIGTAVSVPYTQGKWEGTLGRDLVTLTSMGNVTIEVNIAFITESENFFIPGSNWQGILGLAYAEIARPDASVEPFLDTLEQETGISRTFSLQLCGSTDVLTDTSMNGSLVFGGIDESLYDGPIYYVPMYKKWYYEIIITNISVSGIDLELDCKEYNFDKTIVDSGTTNFRLPHRTFEALVQAIQSKTITSRQIIEDGFWSGDELLCWPVGETPWLSFPSIEIYLAMNDNETVAMTISPQQYLRAVTEDEVILVHEDGENCYKFSISPSDTGTVLGAVVLEGYYAIFDRENGRVGFAKSTCNNRDPTAIQPSMKGPQPYDNTRDCAYIKPESNQSPLLLAAYVMAGICGLCLLPLVYIIIQWQISKCRRKNDNQTETATSDIRGLLNEDEIGER